MSSASARPERSILRRLFDLSWPVAGVNVLNVLAIFVDTVMCSRLEEAEVALAALGFASQVVFLLMTASFGLTVGTVALVSRAHGAGDRKRVDHVLTQSTWLIVLIAVGVAVAGNLLAGPILEVLGASPVVREAGVRYLRPMLSLGVFAYLSVLYGAVFRGIGNTRLPFFIAILTNLANFLLNYGFILGNWGFPALGVAGAGWGTVGAYAVTMVVYLLILTRPNPFRLKLSLWPRGLDRALVRETLRVGAPAALDSVIMNVSFLAVLAMLGHIDEVAVGAHGIGLRVQGLAFVPGLGVSMALAAMVGQALGAERIEEARAVVRAGVFLCLGIMSSIAVVFLVWAAPLVSVFDAQPGTPLGDLSVLWIRILGWSMPVFGLHIALVGLFQGAGDTAAILRINALGTFVVQIPLGLILAFPLGLGVAGVWWSFPAGFAVKVILEAILYRRGRWARTGVHV
ncbi:MAG: MATE family efflux transporter [Myxococcota bacterium]